MAIVFFVISENTKLTLNPQNLPGGQVPCDLPALKNRPARP